MGKYSYGMLVYQPPGLKPRRFLFYDAFPKNSGVQEVVGLRGFPTTIAERHKKLFANTDTRIVTDATYASLEDLVKIHANVPESREGLKHLLTDIVQSAQSLTKLGMTNVNLIIWKVEHVKHRQTEIL